jgi:hypothetical protein
MRNDCNDLPGYIMFYPRRLKSCGNPTLQVIFVMRVVREGVVRERESAKETKLRDLSPRANYAERVGISYFSASRYDKPFVFKRWVCVVLLHIYFYMQFI